MRIGLIGLLLGLCLPAQALAGSFNVVPVKLNLGPGRATAILKITNQGDASVPVQVSVRAWSQDERGEAVYADTEDVVAFPRLLSIAPGEERVVRVGYQGPDVNDAPERAYRVFLEELPGAGGPVPGLTMNLRLGVPVFVAPRRARARPEVKDLTMRDGVLAVTVANPGDAHVVVGRMAAVGVAPDGSRDPLSEARGWYVLAGRTRTFRVSLPADACRASRVIELKAEAEGTDLTGRLDVDPARCAPAP